METHKYIYQTVALLLFALLLGFQISKVFGTPFWYDDAVFAVVAKNLAMGNGYAITLFDTISLFHHGITMGPMVIIPAAFMIALLGNAYWVTSITSVVLIGILLMIAFNQLRYITPLTKWQCAAAFLLSAMLLTNHEIGFAGEKMMVWHELLGEVPSALFVIITALFIANKRDDPNILFWGGIIAGLGGLCKLQSVIGSGTLGVYLIASYLRTSTMPAKQKIKNLFCYGLGVAFPIIAFEIIKIIGLGAQNYLSELSRLIFNIQDYNNNPDTSVFLQRLYILGQYLGICSDPKLLTPLQPILLFLIPAGFAGVFLCYSFRLLRNNGQIMLIPPSAWAAGALAWCAGAHIFWYIFINSVLMPRYITQGMLYGCAAAALLISQTPRSKFMDSNIVFAIFASILLCARSDAAEYLWKGMRYSEYFEEQQHVYQQLKDIQVRAPETLFFSCGYVFEMDYLLPKAANFILCDKISDPDFTHHKSILLSYEPSVVGKVLYGDPNGHIVRQHDIPEKVRKLCPNNDIYSGKHYFIASCRMP